MSVVDAGGYAWYFPSGVRVQGHKQLRYLGTSNFVVALGSVFVRRRFACSSARRLTRAYKALNTGAFPDLVSALWGDQ